MVRLSGYRTLTSPADVIFAVQTLQNHLNEYFQAQHVDPLRPPPRVIHRPTNGHLVIKGKWVTEVRAFMEENGL